MGGKDAVGTEVLSSKRAEDLASGRAVVLGGTGFLGAEIARALLEQGDEVVVVARRAPSAQVRERLGEVTVMPGDVDDAPFLESALADADRVVYAVGCPFPAESNLDPVGDVEQTLPSLLRVLQAMRRRPGRRFTFISSGGAVYGNPRRLPVTEESRCDPLTSYGIMKLASEHYVELYRDLYGVDGHVVRVSNAYGSTQVPGRGQGVVAAFLDAARRGDVVRVYGDGSIVRDYVHAVDVASAVAALARLADAPPVCNVGSGVGHSVSDVLDLVEVVTGRSLPVERLADRSFDVRSIVLDVTRLASVVDWHPRDLRDGISDTWATLTVSRHDESAAARLRDHRGGADQ